MEWVNYYIGLWVMWKFNNGQVNYQGIQKYNITLFSIIGEIDGRNHN